MVPDEFRFELDIDGPVSVLDYGRAVGAAADATPVVCIHGLASSAVSWHGVARALGPGFRVLAVDLPGHGRSPAAGRSLAAPDLAAVLERVIDELALPPVHLVGHSMGAMVSVFAAASRPDQVASLSLLAPPLPRRGVAVCTPSLVPHVALCLFPRIGMLALKRRRARSGVQAYIEQGLRLTCGDLDLGELTTALAHDFRAARLHGEDPIESFIEAARSAGVLVTRGTRYRQAIRAVRAPAQVVHGARDRVVRADEDSLGRLHPTWSGRVLPGVGHSPHLEMPATVAEGIRRMASGCGDRREATLAEPAAAAAPISDVVRASRTGWGGRSPELV